MLRSGGSNCDHNWVNGFCRNCGDRQDRQNRQKQRRWVPNYYEGEIKVNIMTSSGSDRARMVLEELDSRGMLEAEEGPIVDIKNSLVAEAGQPRAMRMVIGPTQPDRSRKINLYSIHLYTDMETGEVKESSKKMPSAFYDLAVNDEGRISGNDGIQLISSRLLRLKRRKVYETDSKDLRGWVTVHGQVTQLIRLALKEGRFAQGGYIDMSPEKQGVFFNCFGPDDVEIPDQADGFYAWRCPPPRQENERRMNPVIAEGDK